MLLEREQNQQEQSQKELFQQVTNWLQDQAQAYGISVSIPSDQIEERQGDYYQFIMVPVRIHDEMDAYDKAKILGKMERPWNEQEPRPEKLLFLYPAGVPRHAV